MLEDEGNHRLNVGDGNSLGVQLRLLGVFVVGETLESFISSRSGSFGSSSRLGGRLLESGKASSNSLLRRELAVGVVGWFRHDGKKKGTPAGGSRKEEEDIEASDGAIDEEHRGVRPAATRVSGRGTKESELALIP